MKVLWKTWDYTNLVKVESWAEELGKKFSSIDD
jgi:hypothetical protein